MTVERPIKIRAVLKTDLHRNLLDQQISSRQKLAGANESSQLDHLGWRTARFGLKFPLEGGTRDSQGDSQLLDGQTRIERGGAAAPQERGGAEPPLLSANEESFIHAECVQGAHPAQNMPAMIALGKSL